MNPVVSPPGVAERSQRIDQTPGQCFTPTSSSVNVGRWPRSGWRPIGTKNWPKRTSLNATWKAAWKASSHQRCVFLPLVVCFWVVCVHACANSAFSTLLNRWKWLCVHLAIFSWVWWGSTTEKPNIFWLIVTKRLSRSKWLSAQVLNLKTSNSQSINNQLGLPGYIYCNALCFQVSLICQKTTVRLRTMLSLYQRSSTISTSLFLIWSRTCLLSF